MAASGCHPNCNCRKVNEIVGYDLEKTNPLYPHGCIEFVKFTGKLSYISFSGYELHNVVFEDVIFKRVDFNCSKISNVDFIRCNINELSLTGVVQEKINFIECYDV